MSRLCDAKEEIERLNAINAELMESEDRQISLSRKAAGPLRLRERGLFGVIDEAGGSGRLPGKSKRQRR
jgi:hypothetical protein